MEDSKSVAAPLSQEFHNKVKKNGTNSDEGDPDDDEEDDSVFNHPIILFPGLAASKIEARLNKTKIPRFLCNKRSDWYTIWITPSELIPYFIDCFKDNFVRIFDEKTGRTSNSPGVETRVPHWGNTTGIEYISDYHISLGNYLFFRISVMK